MNISNEHLVVLQSYGYAVKEARFLYVVATHSGYFTQQQFLRFANVAKGGTASRLVAKLVRLRHARAIRYKNGTVIYNLYSRLIYGVIGKDNLRNRRRLSNELIHTRLLILDFVLRNLEHEYLETEAEKLAYFHGKLHIPLPAIPGRIYKGLKSNTNTKRYFVDRFPILISCCPDSLFSPLAPTFVYCDSDEPGLLRYIAHLKAYENLLNQLPAFTFVYAAGKSTKFKRAEKFFTRFFSRTGTRVDHLLRYFGVRELWENHKTAGLTRSDRELLRAGDRRYNAPIFHATYQRWVSSRLSEAELEAVLRENHADRKHHFLTHLLSDSYDIFERLSQSYRPQQTGTEIRNSGSTTSSSQLCLPVSSKCVK